MSLLKRLEHGGAATPASSPAPADPGAPNVVNFPEQTFVHRPAAAVNQATEAQRSLKDRVKRKLIAELDNVQTLLVLHHERRFR